MTETNFQKHSQLQKMLDKILNDPFLDSSLDFYSHRLKIEEIEEYNKKEVVEKPFSYVGNQGQFSSIEIQQQWQYHIMKNMLGCKRFTLELPYRHQSELHFIIYQYEENTHILELSTSYSLFSDQEYSPTLAKELIEKIALLIRYQVLSVYSVNPFLLKNLFVFAHSQLWNFYLSLKENSSLNFDQIYNTNLELQKSLIKAYLEHSNPIKKK